MALAAVRHKGEQGGITCIEDLEHFLKLIGRLDLAIEANETDLNIEKQKLKETHIRRKQQLEAERQPLLAAVETYVTANRDLLLDKKKAINLNFGKVGWRKSKDDIPNFPKKGSEEMEELVSNISYHEVPVPTHIDRYVMKSAALKLTSDQLEIIGLLKVFGDDVFFVEPDREKLAETADL